ncbi:hypothetical protein B0H14DRAFT_3533113 [Mycena olivaceomarginata]|nr:hypothetical protein B0H14DRAFT_3533113 [Mycena olivaceomarginata]
MSAFNITGLLNPPPPSSPDPPHPPAQRVDASSDLRLLFGAVSRMHTHDGPVLVTPAIQLELQHVISSLTQTQYTPGDALPHALPAPRPPPQQPLTVPRTAEYGARVSPRSRLSVLYRYEPGVNVEYPESGVDAPVGHLIPVDPSGGGRLPWSDFAYSHGQPDGGTPSGEYFYTNLLVDRHGVKASKRVPTVTLARSPGLCTRTPPPTREDVERRLAAARDARQQFSSPQRDTFLKTAAYIGAVRRLGCRRPRQQPTVRTGQELQHYELEQNRYEHFRRGYSAPPTCQGRIIYHEYPRSRPQRRGSARVPEHYSRRTPDHWADFAIQDAGYDADYIAAYFLGNTAELARIEQAAAQQNIGPLAFCDTVRNYSAQTLHCPVDHRVGEHLTHAELCHIECDVKYRIWYPADRQQCPYVLVTSKGTHQHPIPLPEKTPQRPSPGPTRHDSTTLPPPSGPQNILDEQASPPRDATLTALHPSLANRAHLAAYIALIREEHFPHGTDWKGILHLKAHQDAQLPEHQRYIRVILELDDHTLTPHEEDEEAPPSVDKKTRIIVCMAPESSARLQNAQYLQSDIGFKRIVGFDEFEIAAMDRDANTTIVFCRVYVTRHTAAAHQRIFHEINQIVLHDTGRPQLWRHLHGTSTEDFSVGLILHWGADQHRGQAKGLGLHLMDRAAELPADAMDLHEPHRLLRLLTPYDHLRRLYRVCRIHNYRNIQQCGVPEHVRQLMRSLACVRHHDWTGTLNQIICDGGKAAEDKEACKFAFAGICWERSYIPLPVWAAGDPHTNLIETVHRDANREGVHCTLVGGVLLRQDYDELQRATLIEYEQHGIRSSYRAVSSVSNAIKNVKRRGNRQAARVQSTALAVSTHNSNMQNFDAKLRGALGRIDQLNAVANAPHLQSTTHQTELKRQLTSVATKARRAAVKYDKQVQIGQQLRGAGCAGSSLPPEYIPKSLPRPLAGPAVSLFQPPVPPCPLLASRKPRCVGRGSVFPGQVIAAETLPGVRRATFLGLPSWSSPPHVARYSTDHTLHLYIWPFDIAFTFRIPCPAVWTPLYVVGEDHGLGLGQSQWRTSVSKPASSAQQLANGPASSAQPSTPSTFGRLLIQARSLAFGARGFPRSSVLRRAPPRMSLINKSEWCSQYYTSLPTASSIVPPAALAPAPNASPDLVLSFAPVHALPTAPAARCAPGRCDICDAQRARCLTDAPAIPTFTQTTPALDVETHSLEAGKHFYVAIPARDEGIYTSFAVARQKTEGVVNGLHVAAKTYTDAKGLWVRERLQRLDARNKHWGLKGSDVICGSRSAVFRLAEDADLDDIHIRGDRDAAVVQEWLDEN